MAGSFSIEQRQRVRHKLQTKRGRTQESYMRTSRALMSEMVRLQSEIQVDVQMLASAAVARGVGAALQDTESHHTPMGEEKQ
jgi:hypothetical protein